jgi:hypothetical protein
VNQENGDDWKRALVCGICDCGNALAVNNARLQVFTQKSKSSVNDLFAKTNYRTVPINQSNQGLILGKIPYLITHNDELRQWTYRVRIDGAIDHFSAPAIAIVSSPEPEQKPQVMPVAVVEERQATPQNTVEDAMPILFDESSYWDDWTCGFMEDHDAFHAF